MTKQKSILVAALATAGLLAACGGGGGGGGSTAGGGGSGSSVSLSGVASKGLMANADVKVHPVKTDGSVDLTTVLASTTTQPQTGSAPGTYTLSFSGTKDQPYVVRVTAKADGSTTHLDEVTGTWVALPAAFSMRALVTPSSTGAVTTSATVTPFSEMAVAAAANATGGITVANAAQATSTVTQLLGFDPTHVSVKRADDTAASEDEKKLALVLTAVSKLANDGALGCGTATDKTKCVVDTLASSTTSGSIKLDDKKGGNDVSAALGSAITAVLADATLSGNGNITAGTLAPITGNLACGSSCTAAAPTAVANAISSVKAMLTQLKSDWLNLFGGGSTSPAAIEASYIRQSVTGVQVPVNVWVWDMGAAILGADLYRKVGSTGTLSIGRGPGLVLTDTLLTNSALTALGCSLYQDARASTPSTSAANANYVGCSARFFATTQQNANDPFTLNQTIWRHGLILTPVKDGAGNLVRFDYTATAYKTTFTGSTRTGNWSLPSNTDMTTGTAQNPVTVPASDVFTGSFTPTLQNGSMTGFAFRGDLPGAFDYSNAPTLDATALVYARKYSLAQVNQRHAIDFTGAASVNATTGQVSTTATGSIQAYAAATSTAAESRFTVSRSNVNFTPTVNSSGLNSVDVALNYSTAGASFDGTLLVPSLVQDKSGTSSVPSQVVLTGTLSSIRSGVTSQMLSGTVTASSSGYAQFDATQPKSSTNFASADLSVVGTVTAPGRPRLELALGTSARADGGNGPTTANVTYRSFANGGSTPTQTVALVFTGAQIGTGRASVVLTDTSSGFKVKADGVAGTVDVVTNDAAQSKVGMLDKSKQLLTFIDGSIMSLDFGL